MVQSADAARGDHRHVDGGGDGCGQHQVVAVARAVAVHRGQEDLPGAQVHAFARPGHRIQVGRGAATVGVDAPAGARGGVAPGVDGQHDALAPEGRGAARDEVGVTHGRGVERRLVGARGQHAAHVLD